MKLLIAKVLKRLNKRFYFQSSIFQWLDDRCGLKPRKLELRFEWKNKDWHLFYL